MREFSDFEKQKIRELIDSKKPCIGDFIADSLLVNRGVLIDRTKKEITLIFPKLDKNALTEFFEILSLLDYLEKNRLIFVHKNPNPFPGNFLSSNWKYDTKKGALTDLKGNSIPDIFKEDIPTDIFDTITRYVNSFYHAGTELRKLVEDNFETNEYIQLQEALAQTKLSKQQLSESYKQTSYSKYAFYVSLFALLLTVSISFIMENKVRLNDKQYENLLDRIEKLQQDSIVDSQEFIDSNKCIEKEQIIDSLNNDSSLIKKAQKPNNVYKSLGDQ